VSFLAADDAVAFTEIYERYHGAMYAYLVDFVKIPQLAEDLVHEVFMTIWTRRKQLAIKSSFRSYLYRICRNKALDALKKIASDRVLIREVVRQIENSSSGTSDSISKARHYERLLETAVSAMPPQQRRVFFLVREQGKTYEQAAKALGISRNTIKEHMVKSLRFIRHYFSENGEVVSLLILLIGRYF